MDARAQIPEETRREVFIVIAAYNEARAIGPVVAELRARWPNVVVVDDGSGDGTGDAALAAGATVLTHGINRGQGAALQTGISYALGAGAGYLVTFDADGQHDPGDIDRLLEPLIAGEAHFALGSRFLGARSDIPFIRRLVLKLAVVFTRVTSGIALTDTHNGLRAFTAEGAGRIGIQLDRMAHASEVIDQIKRSGLRFVEVPVHIRYTEYSLKKGQSSANALGVAADYLLDRLTK